MTLAVFADPTPELSDCRRCPRLAAHLDAIRGEDPRSHNAPVGWYGDPEARLLIVGLAPGRSGANRTGIPFTGDDSGDWLWQVLAREGFADGDVADERAPRLTDAIITNAVKCLPPGNRPSAAEVASCRAHLAAEMQTFRNVRVIVALGRIAHDATLAALGAPRRGHPFAHGAVHKLESAPLLIDSFHPSPLNTRTGRMTRAEWRKLWKRAAHLAREQWHVYLLRCGDGTLYTGISNDVAARLKKHASGKGALYTKWRGAVEILWTERATSKSAALSREHAVKKLTRAQKFALAKLDPQPLRR